MKKGVAFSKRGIYTFRCIIIPDCQKHDNISPKKNHFSIYINKEDNYFHYITSSSIIRNSKFDKLLTNCKKT